MSVEPKRKIGRPSRHPGYKLVTTMNFRVRDGLHELLAAESARSGRSISEVIEKIVWDSFHQPALVDQLAERFTQRVVGLVREDLSGA